MYVTILHAFTHVSAYSQVDIEESLRSIASGDDIIAATPADGDADAQDTADDDDDDNEHGGCCETTGAPC